MSKLLTMRQAVAEHVPDGCSVALGLQMEQMLRRFAGVSAAEGEAGARTRNPERSEGTLSCRS